MVTTQDKNTPFDFHCVELISSNIFLSWFKTVFLLRSPRGPQLLHPLAKKYPRHILSAITKTV